jgi:hypothetical protein
VANLTDLSNPRACSPCVPNVSNEQKDLKTMILERTTFIAFWGQAFGGQSDQLICSHDPLIKSLIFSMRFDQLSCKIYRLCALQNQSVTLKM